MMPHTAADSHAPACGALIGPWRVLEAATSGSFGTIFRVVLAAEPSAGEHALKLARQPMDPRFEREADLMERCRSPHLPRLHDRGFWLSPTGRSYPWFVMRWVEGQPLYD
jgi:serine/threonine protein kinase